VNFTRDVDTLIVRYGTRYIGEGLRFFLSSCSSYPVNLLQQENTERRNTQLYVRMIDISAVIAEGGGGGAGLEPKKDYGSVLPALKSSNNFLTV
jgi:hypothetical protein